MKTVIAVIAVLAVLAGAGYFLATGSGKPIGADLSVIGKGKPSLVLAYENYSPDGGEALNRLRKVQSDFDSRLEFVVADLGTPQGRAFAERFKVNNAQALFLSKDGQPLQITAIPADEQELRDHVESTLLAVE